MNSEKTFRMTTMAAVLGAAFPIAGWAAPAAQVDFAIGNVTAVRANGQSRTIGKGAQIEQGETIATNKGRAQLRFTDGAYVSLQPESEFRIDQYRFDGKQDGNEKGFFSLIKGGLRTITGLVGRNNKNNYQVTTSVATIGIRGTEYTIQYGQSVVGTVGEGEINVCNGAGCLSVTNGESYYVQNDAIKPVLTNKRTDLPPPSPEAPPQAFQEAENVTETGDPCSLFPEQCAPASTVLTGTIVAHAGIATNSFATVYDSTSVTLDSSGLLTEFDDFTRTVTLTGPPANTGPGSTGNDGIIAWGRVSGASGGECCFFDPGQPLHYVVGVPTDLVALGGLQGTYTLLGATQPTGMTNGAAGGTLNSMNMVANFQSGGVSGSMNWTLESLSISRSFSGSMDGSAFFASQSTSGATLFVTGFFAGANAVRSGIVYDLTDSALSQGYLGAAALKQTSLVPSP